ncbi:hypothetical protein GUJ93_ZPchr0002g24154 [Zizania palustris]|uniref:Uncharacterized protein n=1 Tax=Zizania palustris TaxID=103762 RepID=A0A8J5S4F6_ZIZPA|nr:hypothetical protein GUJ93_ZPchr0002g24154 [Zizania palustris]
MQVFTKFDTGGAAWCPYGADNGALSHRHDPTSLWHGQQSSPASCDADDGASSQWCGWQNGQVSLRCGRRSTVPAAWTTEWPGVPAMRTAEQQPGRSLLCDSKRGSAKWCPDGDDDLEILCNAIYGKMC